MSNAESILEQFQHLSDEEQDRVVRALTRRRLSAAMRRIADRPEQPLPLSDEEINAVVHEARREMLRARGL